MLSPANDNASTQGQLAFLRQAALDDDFRAELEADPQAALARFGLRTDLEQVPARVTLPSKNAIWEYLESFGLDDDANRLEWYGLIAG